jgi:fibulin 1/2
MNNCVEGQRCDNTIGSFHCVRQMGCGTGYTWNSAAEVCEDDDECLLNTHNCYHMGSNFDCVNTRGSFACVRKVTTTTTLPSLPDDEYYYEEYEDK